MGKFKVRDIVVRIGRNYRNVRTGEKYVVTRVSSYSNAIRLDIDDTFNYDDRFFEKVSIKSFQNLKII